jgi:hypothetical protein
VSDPVILIGAARSGTKLLRDLLALHPELSAVPYDINYVWLPGGGAAHDEQQSAEATPAVRKRIARYVGRFGGPGRRVVEKTVGNTLRVGYVNAVLPQSRFIHLVRDGRDVVASSYEQWRRPADGRYVLRKALSFPILLAPRYAGRYLAAAGRKWVLGQTRSAPWGPRYRGIQQDLREHALIEVCARQWVRCVSKANVELGQLDPARVHLVRYDELVGDPVTTITALARFLDVAPAPLVRDVAGRVDRRFDGRWAERLSAAERDIMLAAIQPTLAELGYV